MNAAVCGSILPQAVRLATANAATAVIIILFIIMGLFRGGFRFSVPPLEIVYKAKSVPYRKYRGERRETGVKTHKSGKRCRIPIA